MDEKLVERLLRRVAEAPTPHHWHHVDLTEAAAVRKT